jgi:RNA polymerase sigma-70 factor (ECF subfamily)
MGWAKHVEGPLAGEPSAPEGQGGVLAALKEHLPVMGKVAMALVGDGSRVESILEEAAREAATTPEPPRDAKPWLLGLVRAASAKQLSKLPLKTRGPDTPPSTERIGVAAVARKALQDLKPTEREAVVLSFIGRLIHLDLAVACYVDVLTAKGGLSRGLEQMLVVENGEKK